MKPIPLEVPGVEDCLTLMEQHQMLPNIREHSIVVARVAEIITNGLVEAGYELSLDLAIAGALLHDIGKTACLESNEDHAVHGHEICLNHNLEAIAPIVAEHVILKNYRDDGVFTEKEIVYYADKRVNHDLVVSLEERLAYILERYGNNNPIRCRAIRKNYARCRDLELKMFSPLEFEPDDISGLIHSRLSIIAPGGNNISPPA